MPAVLADFSVLLLIPSLHVNLFPGNAVLTFSAIKGLLPNEILYVNN
jgi:hypothetical protein